VVNLLQKGRRNMRRVFLVPIIMFVLLVSRAGAQSPADAAAIKQTALDYIEGWYEGNAERMERSLHPELAKRIPGRFKSVTPSAFCF
jgi:hypothetical protein